MGSNIDPEHHLLLAAGSIRQRFPNVVFSKVYRSRAVGMDGADFLNACCRIETGLSASEVRRWLKGIEADHKRDRSHGSWKPRTLDLDLLMLEDEVVDRDLYHLAHLYQPALDLTHLKLSVPVDEQLPALDLRL